MSIFREELFQLPDRPEILFEDYYLAVIVKPFGYNVERHPHYPSLEDFFINHLQSVHPDRKNHFVGVVHRLDVVTGGLVILAKTPMALKNLNEQFANHTAVKKYHALIEGKVKEESGRIEGYIEEIKTEKKSKFHFKQVNGAKKSTLTFEVIDSNDPYTLLDITLETGRFHQIRATFSATGNPVVNDEKYGGKKIAGEGKIHLASHEIKIAHPKTNERLQLNWIKK